MRLIIPLMLTIFLVPGSPVARAADEAAGFLVVDCLLPGQVRQLGKMQYLAARKAIRTTAADCEIRGGEYVAYDRASRASSLKVWLPLAQEGDAEAQNYVGEIYEKGMGAEPDYALAAAWYLQAAEQGNSRAAINLGNLFEQGLGLEQDKAMAAYWYRQASGIDELVAPLPETTPGPSLRATPSASSQPADDGKTSILVVEPPLKTRSGQYFLDNPRLRSGSFPLVGQVTSDKPVQLVLVAGQEAQLIAGSLFRTQVGNLEGRRELAIRVVYTDGSSDVLPIQLGGQSLAATAADSVGSVGSAGSADSGDSGGQAMDVLDLLPATVSRPRLSGRQHALVIGNNDYPELLDLETAVNDAEAIARILDESYGFEVTLVRDANRYTALSAINDLRLNFAEDDRLLVYYAGHGELDRVNNRGHWLPVDAEVDNTANWISNITITDLLNTIPSRQLIVVADSCYSGMMSRSALGVIDQAVDDAKREQLLKSLAGMRTRTALTSGGVAPVLDSGGGGHSVFARAFLDVLEKNRGAITGLELFRAVSVLVEQRAASLGFSQQPEYAPLKFAGHEAGDFVFVRQ